MIFRPLSSSGAMNYGRLQAAAGRLTTGIKGEEK